MAPLFIEQPSYLTAFQDNLQVFYSYYLFITWTVVGYFRYTWVLPVLFDSDHEYFFTSVKLLIKVEFDSLTHIKCTSVVIHYCLHVLL